MDYFSKPCTIPLEFEMRNKDTGALADPATSVKITVTDSLGTKQVDDQAMTKKSTGIYYYNFQLLTTHESGTWTARVTATDGTKISNSMLTNGEDYQFGVVD